MKKRKELNALIGLGDGKRKKTKKSSGHRLLLRSEAGETETESSSDGDEEEFSSLSGAGVFRKGWWRCCSVCYPLLAFIVLMACLMACAGLIWMQIALKEDLDLLKEKLRTMESSQKASAHDIPKLSEELKVNQRTLEDMDTGDRGLSKLWNNFTDINKKIISLDSAVNHLKTNIKSASDLISLPTTVEELQKSVATIGSTLTSVQHDVKMIQVFIEEQKKEKQRSEMDSVDGDDEGEKMNEAPEDQNHSAGSPTAPGPSNPRHRRFLNQNRVKREVLDVRQNFLFPGVESAEDLEKLLRAHLDFSSSEGLSYEQLRKIFSTSTPARSLLEPYDENGDGRFTLSELQAAAAL